MNRIERSLYKRIKLLKEQPFLRVTPASNDKNAALLFNERGLLKDPKKGVKANPLDVNER